MVQPLSYYQNQFFDNALKAISNSLIQLPVQIQGSLIAYDNINDWFKFSLNNSNITANVNVVNAVTMTGSVNTTIVGSNITQNVAVVNTVPITGMVNTVLVGNNVTSNVSVVNTPNVNIIGTNITQKVAVVNTVPITGMVNTVLVGNNVTSNVNIVNTPNVNIVGSNITQNVNIVGPLDTYGNVKVDITASELTGSVDVSIIGNNVTSNVSVIGIGYNQINIFSNAFITTGSQTFISTTQYQEMVVDTVYGGVITGSIWTEVYGVEPQSNTLTSLIVAGTTATLNTLTVQRMQIVGPLGGAVAVVVNVAPYSEVTGVFVTAELSVGR